MVSGRLDTARAVALASAVLSGCGVPPPPPGTGGGDFSRGRCGRGLVVVESDYQSTNVALVGPGGDVLSSSFVSSASADPGLVAALSGDVVAPTAEANGDDVVLLDRYPASVLSWVDLRTAAVRGQLDVSTGFAANPQDYLALSPTKAYVSRYERNPAPGSQAFDGGSDLLVVDPSVPAIMGRIALDSALPQNSSYLPRPSRMLAVGGRVHVLAPSYGLDFADSLPSRVVTIDAASDAIEAVTVLDGAHGCGALALAPDGTRLAIACSGDFGGDSVPAIEGSMLVLLDVSGPSPVEIDRLAATDLLGQPLGTGLDFAGEERLVVTTLGQYGVPGEPDRDDALVEVDLVSRAARQLHAAPAFSLGDVRCVLPCGACFAAEGNALGRHPLGPEGLGTPENVPLDPAIALPPRWLGRF